MVYPATGRLSVTFTTSASGTAFEAGQGALYATFSASAVGVAYPLTAPGEVTGDFKTASVRGKWKTGSVEGDFKTAGLYGNVKILVESPY
jgi:hypothetical protein